MEKLSTIAYGVIALVVVVILIATIAIPVIEDSNTAIRTEANNTTERLVFASDLNSKVEILNNGDGSITVNGYETNNPTANRVLLFWCANVMIKQTSNSIYLTDVNEDLNYVTIKSIVFENGEYTAIKNDDTEITGTLDEGPCFYASEKGSYGLFKYNFYVNEDSPIIAAIVNRTSDMAGVGGLNLIYSGNLKNGFTPVVSEQYSNGEFADIESSFSITPIENPNDTYTIIWNGLEATITYTTTEEIDGVPVEVTATDTVDISEGVIAPISYKYISSNDSMIITLLSIIPLILIIVPVMLAVQLMTGGRRD